MALLLALAMVSFASSEECDSISSVLDPDTRPTLLGSHGEELGTLHVPWRFAKADLGQSLRIRFLEPTLVSSLVLWGEIGAYRVQYKLDDSDATWRTLRTQGGFEQVHRIQRSESETRAADIGLLIVRELRAIPISFAGNAAELYVQVLGCRKERLCLHLTGKGKSEEEPGLPLLLSGRELGSVQATFRSRDPDGVVLSAVSDKSHALLVQIQASRLQIHFDYGWGSPLLLTTSPGLADGRWHSLELRVEEESAVLLVDGVEANATSLPVQRVPNVQPIQVRLGSSVGVYPLLYHAGKEEFRGCLADVRVAGVDLLRQAKEKQPHAAWSTLSCSSAWPEGSLLSLAPDSRLSKRLPPPGPSLELSLEFRSFARDGSLLDLPLGGELGQLKLYISEGGLELNLTGLAEPLQTEGLTGLFPEQYLSDGAWHSLTLRETRRGLAIRLDGRETELASAALPLPLKPRIANFGGNGWWGCIRQLSWDGSQLPFTSGDGVYGTHSFDTCDYGQECNGRRCLNGGSCQPHWTGQGECLCPEGWAGLDCSRSTLFTSCSEAAFVMGTLPLDTILLDLDGSGHLPPFRARCVEDTSGIWTIIDHDAERVAVSGFGPRGSYRRGVEYEATEETLEMLVEASEECVQETRLGCSGGAQILGNGGYSYWSGKGGLASMAWGGAPIGSGGCQCALDGSCGGTNALCNCDGGGSEDVGNVTTLLPIRRLFAGDTMDGKRLDLSIGPLMCRGHAWDVPVTLTAPQTISSSVLEEAVTGALEFKSAGDGLLLTGDSHLTTEWIQLSVNDGQLELETAAGGAVLTLRLRPKNGTLSDGEWHRIQFGLSRRLAWLSLDGLMVERKGDWILPKLNGQWSLGGGELFCELRRVQPNGDVPIQLHNMVPPPPSPCSENTCGNGGKCLGMGTGFTCDCSETAYEGPLCLSEVGASFTGNGWLEHSLRQTETEGWDGSIRFGFTASKRPSGNGVRLLSAEGAYSDAGLEVTLNSSGTLLLRLRSGDGEQSLLSDDRWDYADGLYHSLRIRQDEDGTVLEVTLNSSGTLLLRLRSGDGEQSLLSDDRWDYADGLYHSLRIRQDEDGTVLEVTLNSSGTLLLRLRSGDGEQSLLSDDRWDYADGLYHSLRIRQDEDGTVLEVTLNSSGTLLLRLRSGDGEQSLLSDDRWDYADGLYHSLRIRQDEDGTVLEVDYEKELRADDMHLNLTDTASYWSFGDADYHGCLSGLLIGAGTAPLKLLAGESPRTALRGEMGSVEASGLCSTRASDGRLIEQARLAGLYSPAPEPPPVPVGIRVEAIRPPDLRSLLLGLGLSAGVLLLCLAWLGVRALNQAQGGVYKTHEGEPGLYLSPETSTAPLMPQRREWFI